MRASSQRSRQLRVGLPGLLYDGVDMGAMRHVRWNHLLGKHRTASVHGV